MVSTDLATFAQCVGLAPDSSTLAEALTHSSYAAEHNGTSNERLEFLGDAVYAPMFPWAGQRILDPAARAGSFDMAQILGEAQNVGAMRSRG